MSDDRIAQARHVFEAACQAQMSGCLEEAVRLYKQSIALCPTAEAHTFLGWTYSFQDRMDEAIAECHKAIAVDPTFGNPYNDIGVYLIELGRSNEAIPWLKKAMKAPRYEAYCFPHYNLGRIYESRAEWAAARRCYRRSLKYNPTYVLPRLGLRRLEAWLN